jgi:hypothetical protein
MGSEVGLEVTHMNRMYTIGLRFTLRIALLLTVTTCSIFEPRGAEDPEGIQSGRFIQPDRAEVVLENLTNAVEALNVQNFMASLDASSFVYTPAANNVTTDPELWRNWGREQEQLWLNTIRSALTVQTGHKLQLSRLVEESISQTRVRYTLAYSLTIYHNRTTAGIPAVATGTMTLGLKAGENGLWAIESWTDISDGTSFSWSDLRSAFIRG